MIAFSAGPFVIIGDDDYNEIQVSYMHNHKYINKRLKRGGKLKVNGYKIELRLNQIVINALHYTIVYPAPDGWAIRDNGTGYIIAEETPITYKIQ